MSRRIPYLACALLGLLSAATLGGCEDNSVGTFDLQVTGVALGDTQNLVLAIKGVQLGGDGRQTDLVYGDEQLVDINASRSTIVDAVHVSADAYKWVRLEINPADSYVIASNGGRYALDVASLYQSTADFTVHEGQTTQMVVDIDMRHALSFETQGGVRVYTLKPVSRLVDLQTVGNIVGTVSNTLMVGGLAITDPRCDPQVYAYPGTGVVPQGYFVTVKGGTSPFASSSLSLNAFRDIYSFRVTLLPPGHYTAAVSCASVDVPGSTGIDFSPTQDATVTADTDSTVDF